ILNGTTHNIATARGTTGGASVSATATATVTAHTCGIHLTKTPDCPDICSSSNTPVTFTYVVRNTGNFFPVTGGSVVDDNGTPGNPGDDVTVGTWTSLPVSGSLTFTHIFTLNGTRTNTATARGRSGPVCEGPA